ncbi:hypothetical protein GCM10007989_01030 [Devosia pacifica]|uniref:Uncharacterized protein n=1 Tax=Devosia pacifica TaxID=1335967 RepID=A0A918RVR6_9HYPH|nr:hypothetical protein GCM10007989_01030 [Devosia pacifica]
MKPGEFIVVPRLDPVSTSNGGADNPTRDQSTSQSQKTGKHIHPGDRADREDAKGDEGCKVFDKSEHEIISRVSLLVLYVPFLFTSTLVFSPMFTGSVCA